MADMQQCKYAVWTLEAGMHCTVHSQLFAETMGQLGGGMLMFYVKQSSTRLRFSCASVKFCRTSTVWSDKRQSQYMYTTAIRNMILPSYLPFTNTFLPGGKVEILSILVSSQCVIYLRRKSTFLLLIGEMRGTHFPLFYVGERYTHWENPQYWTFVLFYMVKINRN